MDIYLCLVISSMLVPTDLGKTLFASKKCILICVTKNIWIDLKRINIVGMDCAACKNCISFTFVLHYMLLFTYSYFLSFYLVCTIYF